MTALSRQILDEYQIRKTRKQKDAFIQLLESRFPELSIEQSAIVKSRNLIIGDPERAQLLLSAHYDTCAQLPFPNFITPKNPILSILYSLLIILPMTAILFLFNFLLNLLTADFWIHYCLTLVAYFGFFWLILAGPANRHNANDNTSGVITLCELLERFTPAQRDKVAFIFFDNEESGLLGSSFFRSKHRQIAKDKLLINFDCVSDGDNLMFALTKAARSRYAPQLTDSLPSPCGKRFLIEKAERIYYPSDQVGFDCSIAVAALKHHKLLGYYMDRIHTRRDIIFQQENIDCLCAAMQEFINNI